MSAYAEPWRYKCYRCDATLDSRVRVKPICPEHRTPLMQVAPRPRWFYTCDCGRLAGFDSQPDTAPQCHEHRTLMTKEER